MSPTPAFDTRTLDQLLAALARFSAGGPGVTRFTYDPTWCDANRWLRVQATSLGLDSTMDAAGNLLFHDAAVKPGDLQRPVLMVGSHLDSVKHGGRFDGAYGTIAGLLLAARHRGRPGLPVVGFVTCEEEQSRFNSHMMGARSLLGLVEAGELESVHDGDGVTWREALSTVREAGCAAEVAAGTKPFPPVFRAALQLELHIEPGPRLEAEGIPLGIVAHIAGYRRLRATVRGEARHSGTTPMGLRHDAFAAAAAMVLAVEALAREVGDPAVATAGNARVSPGLYNVVAGECELWLEVRHVTAAALASMASDLVERCQSIAQARGVVLTIDEVSRQDPTPLSTRLATEAEALAGARGIRHLRMASGAAHDSMEFARAGVVSLMLFVPSQRGISHSPDEFTRSEALWAGVEFASALIDQLAAEAGAR